MASPTQLQYVILLNFFILGSLVGCDGGKHSQERERQKQMEAKRAEAQAKIDADVAVRRQKVQIKQLKEKIKRQKIAEGVGIKDWSWEPLTEFAGESIANGDVISIKFTLTNNTPHKLINAKLDVYLWNERNRSILKDDTKVSLLAQKTVTCFTDSGYDFCPSNHIKKAQILIPIQKYSSSSVKSVSLTLLSTEPVEMTDIDARLTKLYDYIKSQEAQGKDAPDQSYAAQARMLQEKKQLNGGRSVQ